MPPANAEDCVNVAGIVTCAPGTDADGFFDITGSSIVLDVQAGSVVQGPIIVTGATTGLVDGAIIASFDFAELRGGVEVAAQVSSGVSGYVRGTVVHDLNDEVRSFQLTSTDTGSFAVALPGQERDRFELAAGAANELSPNASVELGYLGDFADGYDGHSAQIGLRLAF